MNPIINSIAQVDGGIEISIEGFGPWGIQAHQIQTLSHEDFPVWEQWCTVEWTKAAQEQIKNQAA